VGEFLLREGESLRRIGLIGLGTGALAVYFEKGQEVDFYELDPDVYAIATNYFTYLRQSQGKVNIIFGDARQSLRNNKKRYDVLIVDAFSGDSIPVHLLTTQAINEYRRNLAEGGVIMFHISNRYLNLMPVLSANAAFLGAESCHKENKDFPKEDAFASTWVAFSWDKNIVNKLETKLKWVPMKKNIGFRAWTDKYSNPLRIFRIKNLLFDIRYFTPFYW